MCKCVGQHYFTRLSLPLPFLAKVLIHSLGFLIPSGISITKPVALLDPTYPLVGEVDQPQVARLAGVDAVEAVGDCIVREIVDHPVAQRLISG